MSSYFRSDIDAMHGYVPGEQPRDPNIVKLNTNENPYPASPAVVAALADLNPRRLNRYPDPVSSPVLQTIADTFGYTPEWVVAGNGSDDILTIVTRAIVGAGGTIATIDPSYSLYPVLAAIQGASARLIPLASDFGLPDDLAEQAAGTPLLFIPRPNAPTGNAFSLDAMHTLCQRFAGVVLIDEAYVDFAEDSCLGFPRQYDNVIVSRTLSKGYSLAGIRFGFAIAQPHLIAGLMKVKDSYNVNYLTQLAATAAIADQDYLLAQTAKVCATRQRTTAELTALGFHVCPSQANFLFAQPPIAAADYFAALREHAIIVRYFPGPLTGDYVRITIGTDAEMDTFLAATRTILS